jgi:hypothetical protein
VLGFDHPFRHERLKPAAPKLAGVIGFTRARKYQKSPITAWWNGPSERLPVPDTQAQLKDISIQFTHGRRTP